ncbi:hypothetical protein PT285_11300 [Lactobacillus sp. ESL0791]|uniref:hypothetical protein n=1 Tax=Lactobacillus sp. ESL0791 TaxID=2983234 RepID=UPI0023F756DB|nr:hypothetical protein [Lactobacillus sp. ESL0791]MDF7639988.1 hypothetical protein [Lactobacillus sp. ESL0791]
MTLKKTVITGLTTLALSPVAAALGNGILTTQVVHADTITANTQQSNNDETKTFFTNEELFDVLEAKGYNVKSILGEKEYQAALTQDLMRNGGTYVSTNSHGFTLYVNSALVKIAAYGGAGAISYALSTVLVAAGHPLVAATAATIITNAAGNNKACERGIYIRFSNKGNPITWGCQ